MNQSETIKQDSIKEFGSKATQKRYHEIAQKGLWESEEILIKKYFKPNIKILDIGCGSGRTTLILHTKGYDVLGDKIFNTWSCYKNGKVQCGKCESCNNRKAAFLEAGIDDKTLYSLV